LVSLLRNQQRRNVMITNIATAAVYVEDQNKAVEFWTKKVGFVVHREKPMSAEAAWIEVGPKGARSCLVIFPRTMMANWNERKPSIVFDCLSVKDTHNDMIARGVEFAQIRLIQQVNHAHFPRCDQQMGVRR